MEPSRVPRLKPTTPSHYTLYDIGGSKGMVVGKRKPPKGARAGVHRRRESPEGGGAQACAPPTRKGEVVTCRAVILPLRASPLRVYTSAAARR